MRRAKFLVSFEAMRKALNLPDDCEIIKVEDPEPRVYVDRHVYVYVEGSGLPEVELGRQCLEIVPGFTSRTVTFEDFYKWNMDDEERFYSDEMHALRKQGS